LEKALELSRRAAAWLQPEDRDPRLAEAIAQAEGERHLGPDHHEVDPLALREGDHLVHRRVLDGTQRA
jgi:hypothetical protein